MLHWMITETWEQGRWTKAGGGVRMMADDAEADDDDDNEDEDEDEDDDDDDVDDQHPQWKVLKLS